MEEELRRMVKWIVIGTAVVIGLAVTFVYVAS